VAVSREGDDESWSMGQCGLGGRRGIWIPRLFDKYGTVPEWRIGVTEFRRAEVPLTGLDLRFGVATFPRLF